MCLIDLRYCKKCEEAYDIETNYDLCPRCRGLIKIGVIGDGKEK